MPTPMFVQDNPDEYFVMPSEAEAIAFVAGRANAWQNLDYKGVVVYRGIGAVTVLSVHDSSFGSVLMFVEGEFRLYGLPKP